MTEKPPSDPADHAEDFAHRYAEPLDRPGRVPAAPAGQPSGAPVGTPMRPGAATARTALRSGLSKSDDPARSVASPDEVVDNLGYRAEASSAPLRRAGGAERSDLLRGHAGLSPDLRRHLRHGILIGA